MSTKPFHVKWPKVYTLRAMLRQFVGPVSSTPIRYRAKVKLHGTNAGIHVEPDGSWWAMSRKRILGPTKGGWSDNHGFAMWAHSGAGQEIADRVCDAGIAPITIFGEWCGPGIQNGVACSAIPRKSWFVFGVRHEVDGIGKYTVEPDAIKWLIDGLDDTYTIPWHTWPEQVRQMNLVDPESVQSFESEVDLEVARIGGHDPLIADLFGVDGPGEGLVLFADDPHDSISVRMGTTWKAKAEQFAETKPATKTPIDASKSIRAEILLNSVLTDHRIEKVWEWVTEECRAAGLDPLDGMPIEAADKVYIKPVMAWMAPLMKRVKEDVMSECAPDFNDAQLSWRDVGGRVGGRLREWLKKAAERS